MILIVFTEQEDSQWREHLVGYDEFVSTAEFEVLMGYPNGVVLE